jgi:hypothetical protein
MLMGPSFVRLAAMDRWQRMPAPVIPVLPTNVDFQIEFVPADGCHFQEAETSVRRRFLGSSQSR